MKMGDLVRYKERSSVAGSTSWLWCHGLLIKFDKVQRMCIILDNKTGKLIKKHCNDVQLEKAGHANR